MRTKLELLQSSIIAEGLDASAAGERLGDILKDYATNLPVEARGN